MEGLGGLGRLASKHDNNVFVLSLLKIIMVVVAIGAICPAMGEGCGGCGKGLRDWLGLGWKILTRNLLFLTGFRFLGIFSDLVVKSRPNQAARFVLVIRLFTNKWGPGL